jgi:phosphatidylglycerophosphatase C
MHYKRDKKLALFDFDGTLTKKDTLLAFTLFYHGRLKYLLGLIYLSPILILFKLKLIKNIIAKERFLKYFFTGITIESFEKKCHEFSKQIVPSIIRPEAARALAQRKINGFEIYVVSASAQNWVKPWCLANDISCIATQLEVVSNKLTGKISGHNCYGIEKLNRIKAEIDINSYSEIAAYGDSKGDLEMSSIATKYFFRTF